MTKAELKAKGITPKMLTDMMHRAEKLISYFNETYAYDINLATAHEQIEWESTLNRWDIMKSHRDTLNG